MHVFFIRIEDCLVLSSEGETWLVSLVLGCWECDMFGAGRIPLISYPVRQSAAFTLAKGHARSSFSYTTHLVLI